VAQSRIRPVIRVPAGYEGVALESASERFRVLSR
jgi:hypothetical protein